MTSDRFLMDNGGGEHTKLWRQRIEVWVWRDAPAGYSHAIQLHDEDGHPVDAFGEPIDGTFLEPSPKNPLTDYNVTHISGRPASRKD